LDQHRAQIAAEWIDTSTGEVLARVGCTGEHILDLRARFRSRHTLSHQRCQWQQRIQAVLYHHGCSHRRRLIVDDGREWLDAEPLPETARCGLALSLWSDHLDASGLRLGCAFQPLI
jgi:hypothetical protein